MMFSERSPTIMPLMLLCSLVLLPSSPTPAVDHVIPGGRMRITVPSENVTILFGLAGVRCPATAAKAGGRGADGKVRPARAGEPCGEESYRWLRESVNQQEVELEVEEGDRTGAMLGALWMGKGGARKSLGAELLRRGLGYGVHPIIERVRYADELCAAENDARAAKRGVWEHYVEGQGEEGEGEEQGVELDTAAALAAAMGGATISGGAGSASSSAAFPALGGQPVPGPTGAVPSTASAATGAGASASASASGIIKGSVCEVTDGAHFWLQAEGDKPKLASVAAKMEEMMAEHVSLL